MVLRRLFGRSARRAKIEYPDLSRVGNHNIVRLQIRVNNVASMCMLQPGPDLADDGPCLRAGHRQRLESTHHAAQEFPLEKLHRKKIQVSVPVQLEYVDNIAVGKHL